MAVPRHDPSVKTGRTERATPCPFTPGKETQFPLYGTMGGHGEKIRRVKKTSSPKGLDFENVQQFAILYIYRLTHSIDQSPS